MFNQTEKDFIHSHILTELSFKLLLNGGDISNRLSLIIDWDRIRMGKGVYIISYRVKTNTGLLGPNMRSNINKKLLTTLRRDEKLKRLGLD